VAGASDEYERLFEQRHGAQRAALDGTTCDRHIDLVVLHHQKGFLRVSLA